MEQVLMYMLVIILILITLATLMLLYAILTINTGPNKREIDAIDAVTEYYSEKEKLEKDQRNNHTFWTKFSEEGTVANTENIVNPATRNSEGKYNPEEVSGALDGLFETTQTKDTNEPR